MVSVDIRPDTKEALDQLKIHPRETYNDVIIKLLTERKEKGEK